jgi:hypothetical protein
VLDNKNKLKKIVKCVFEKSTSFPIFEHNNEPSIDLYTKLVDKNDGTIYSVSLNKVATEFRRLQDI